MDPPVSSHWWRVKEQSFLYWKFQLRVSCLHDGLKEALQFTIVSLCIVKFWQLTKSSIYKLTLYPFSCALRKTFMICSDLNVPYTPESLMSDYRLYLYPYRETRRKSARICATNGVFDALRSSTEIHQRMMSQTHDTSIIKSRRPELESTHEHPDSRGEYEFSSSHDCDGQHCTAAQRRQIMHVAD